MTAARRRSRSLPSPGQPRVVCSGRKPRDHRSILSDDRRHRDEPDQTVGTWRGDQELVQHRERCEQDVGIGRNRDRATLMGRRAFEESSEPSARGSRRRPAGDNNPRREVLRWRRSGSNSVEGSPRRRSSGRRVVTVEPGDIVEVSEPKAAELKARAPTTGSVPRPRTGTYPPRAPERFRFNEAGREERRELER